MALAPEERAVVEAAIKFANLGRITSAAQVEKLFAGINSPVFQTVGTNYKTYIENDQPRLRRWLRCITGNRADRDKVTAEVAPFLAEKLAVLPVLEGRRLHYRYFITGVEGACGLAVALLLDESRGLADRLKQCGYSKCHRFNLDLHPKGRPRRFCPGHKELHDRETGAERQQRYRNKQRAE